MTVFLAILIGLAVMTVGIWAIRLLATPVPGEPDPEEVVSVDVAYRCTVCGLGLTVTQAQAGDMAAPRHCREEMEPVG